MSSNVVNQTPYLRTSRNFPVEAAQLTVEVNKAYVDIANAVNNRTIGIFPSGNPAVGGESWFVSSSNRQQSLRQIYPFTAVGNIPHNIRTAGISIFTKCSGSFTNGTNWFGAIFGSDVVIAGQVSFYITPTVGTVSGNIVILAGVGAPAISKGIIVLEWLSNP